MSCESFPDPKEMLTIRPSSFSANAVALRLSDSPHQAAPRISNATAPQLRLLQWLYRLEVTKLFSCGLATRLASD